MALPKRNPWLKVGFNAEATAEVNQLMQRLNLNTVCREANCPNLGECFKRGTATFMILGSQCTRNCRYCNIKAGRPDAVDPEEPEHLAEAASALGLKHIVITSVARDDLADGGASQFAAVIKALRLRSKQTTIEVLIPDFKGDEDALMTVLEAGPDVLNHNIECVKELFAVVRPQGGYDMSLELLKRAKAYSDEHAGKPVIKTGAILGMGETDEQLLTLFDDLAAVGCELLTLGQYLRPSKQHLEVDRYVSPDEFKRYREQALDAGLKYVVAGPLIRSSYKAEEALNIALKKNDRA